MGRFSVTFACAVSFYAMRVELAERPGRTDVRALHTNLGANRKASGGGRGGVARAGSRRRPR